MLWIQDQQIHDNFGVQGNLNFDSNNDNLGILVNIVPTWNFRQQEVIDQLFGNQSANQHVSELTQNESDTNLYAEVGYGLELATHNSSFTPFSSIELQNTRNQTFRLGGKFRVGHNISLDIENSYNMLAANENNNKIKLSGRLQW